MKPVRQPADVTMAEPATPGDDIVRPAVGGFRPRGRLLTALQKYGKIFRISLTERMVYRADFLLSTFLRFLPMLTTILLWQAIFSGAGKKENGQLAGFRFHDMIAYL